MLAELMSFAPQCIFLLYRTGKSVMDPSIRLILYLGASNEVHHAKSATIHLHDMHLGANTENLVQKIAVNYIMYYKILCAIPAVALGSICGAWSDKVGRKPPIVFTMFWMTIACLFYMVAALNSDHWLAFFLVGAAVMGLCGNSSIISMALYSIVADISSEKYRTRKIGFLTAMNFFGNFFGSCIFAWVSNLYDLKWNLMVVIIFLSSACMLSLFALKEVVGDGKIHTPFHCQYMRESLNVYRKSDQKSSVQLFMYSAAILIHQMCVTGRLEVLLLFVERDPLHWTRATYGYFLANHYISLGLGLFVVLPFLEKKFKMTDLHLVTIGIFFMVIRDTVLAFSRATWMVFLSSIVGAPSAMIPAVLKSMISKIVSNEDNGKIFALISCGEVVFDLIGTLLFSYLYKIFITFFPGMVFEADALIFLLLFVALWLTPRETDVSYSNMDEEDKSTETVEQPNGTPHMNGVRGTISMETHRLQERPHSAHRNSSSRGVLETDQSCMELKNLP